MVFCSNCGEEISNDSRFCEYCGAKNGEKIYQNEYTNQLNPQDSVYKTLRRVSIFLIPNFILDIITIGIVYYLKFIQLKAYTPNTPIYYTYKLSSVYEIWFVLFIICIIQCFIYFTLINSKMTFVSFKNLLLQVLAPTLHLIALMIVFLVLLPNNQLSGIVYSMIDAGIIIGVISVPLRALVFRSSEVSLLKAKYDINH